VNFNSGSRFINNFYTVLFCFCCLVDDAELLAAATALENDTLVERSNKSNNSQPIVSNVPGVTSDIPVTDNDEQC
jgi:hypothetical protein